MSNYVVGEGSIIPDTCVIYDGAKIGKNVVFHDYVIVLKLRLKMV